MSIPHHDPRITIFGSSHVKRLYNFSTSSEQENPGINGALDIDTGRVTWMGFPGLKWEKTKTLCDSLKLSNADVCVIVTGGNDLDNGSDPATLAYDLVSFAKLLEMPQVYICDIIPRLRPWYLSPLEFSKAAETFNDTLELLLGGSETNRIAYPGVHHWKVRKISNAKQPVHRSDFVHLNNLGNRRLYYNIRHAVLAGIKQI